MGITAQPGLNAPTQMKTADPELMRAINRFHVMDAIRRFGPIARVEISDRTELSATTVAAAIREDLDRRRLAHPSGEGAAGLREEKAGALEAARRK